MSGLFKRLFRRSSISDDIREEMESHIAMRAELNQRSGMSPEEALQTARRQFGNSTAFRERLYEFNGFGWLDTLAGDLLYAFRGLRRSPGLSLTAILTIAIGVGAAASMFGVMRNLLLAPPPHVEAPDRVFRLHQLFFAEAGVEPPSEPFASTSYPFYELLAERAGSLGGVAAYTSVDLAVGAGADARMARAVMASAGFWRTLGVRPAAGRVILDDEAHPATGSRVVVLGHAFWRSRFGGDAGAVGQTLRIKGQPYEIVGVAPRGFRGVELADVDLWLPLFTREDGSGRPVMWHTAGASYVVRVVTRLKAHVTVEQASAELTRLQRSFLEDTYGPMFRDPARLEQYRRARALLAPLTGGLGDDLRPIPEARVTVWLVGVAFVLVAVACSNVAGLLLLRAMRRRREIAVRLALGVSRARLARQLLTESSVLAFLGGLAALVTLIWGGAWLQRTILPAMAWEPSALVDPTVLVVAGLSTLAAALAAGMAPLYYARSAALPALRDGSLGGLVKRPRAQGALLAVQGAFSVVLLVGAALFLRSVHNVETMNIGFDRDSVLAVQVDFSGTGRGDREIAAFFERARERVSAVPGVTQASLSLDIPLRSARTGIVRLPGRDDALSGPRGIPWMNAVTPGFFRTTGLRIVAGREFVEAERNGGSVTVITETMARLGWPDRSPIGECVYLGREKTCTTVIGVIADPLLFNLVDEEPHPYHYTPLATDGTGPRALLVRMAPGVSRIDGAIRQALQELDAGLPFVRVETLGEALNPQIRPWRLGAAVFTAFGMLAMVLAMIGLWSSMSYAVSQRTSEFAVRLAIGAKQTSLLNLVLGDGLRHALAAVAAGLAIAALASGFIADLLFEVSPRDPAIFATIAGVVLAVATLASLLPAWRATRIHPAEALRAD